MAIKMTLSNTIIPVEWPAILFSRSTFSWLLILYLWRGFLFLSLPFSSDIVAYCSLSFCLFCSLRSLSSGTNPDWVWFPSIKFGQELKTYKHRTCREAVKVYIPSCVVFVRSPKGTRSPVGLGVSINTTYHISLTTCSTLDNFGKSRIEKACLKAIGYDM